MDVGFKLVFLSQGRGHWKYTPTKNFNTSITENLYFLLKFRKPFDNKYFDNSLHKLLPRVGFEKEKPRGPMYRNSTRITQCAPVRILHYSIAHIA